MDTHTSRDSLPDCPVEITLKLISNKWRLLILRNLMDGTQRFGELLQGISGISHKVLTTNLRAMEENGLLSRKIYAEVPPRTEYTLTDLGRSMKPILDAMNAWGTQFREAQQKHT